MPAAIIVRPDTDFIRAVLASGGEDLKKCYEKLDRDAKNF